MWKSQRKRRAGRRTPVPVLIRRFLAIALGLSAILMALRPSVEATAAPAVAKPSATSAALPAGLIAVPIRLTDPSLASLLRPGILIDLYAGEHDSALTLVSAGLLVLKVQSPQVSSGEQLESPLIVLGVPSDAAPKIASVTSAGVLVVTLTAADLNAAGP